MIAGFMILTLSGCGKTPSEKIIEKAIEKSSGEKVDVDYKLDGSATYTADGVTVSTSQDLPKDWPKDAAIYPNAKINVSGQSTDTENIGTTVILNTNDAATKVLEWYKSKVVEDGWKVEGAMDYSGIKTLVSKKDGRDMSVMITTDSGMTQIIVGVIDNK